MGEVVPAWLVITGAAAAAGVSVLSLVALLNRMVVKPITSRVDRFEDAAVASVDNKRRLEDIARGVGEIKQQVTYDSGDSLKDRLIHHQNTGDARHRRLDDRLLAFDRRLKGIEAHLSRQDRAADDRAKSQHRHRDDDEPGGSSYVPD